MYGWDNLVVHIVCTVLFPQSFNPNVASIYGTSRTGRSGPLKPWAMFGGSCGTGSEITVDDMAFTYLLTLWIIMCMMLIWVLKAEFNTKCKNPMAKLKKKEKTWSFITQPLLRKLTAPSIPQGSLEENPFDMVLQLVQPCTLLRRKWTNMVSWCGFISLPQNA